MSTRLFEFTDDAEDRLIYLTVDELLVTDDRAALVSVRSAPIGGAFEEVAIRGTGERNSPVLVFRTISTWRLGVDAHVSRRGRSVGDEPPR
jgi:hypothetical protein